MPPKISDAIALEEPPALHEELGFLPPWKRAVYATGAAASWLTALSLAVRDIPGLHPGDATALVAVLMVTGALAARPAARGTVDVSRPGRLDRLALEALLVLGALALVDGLWLGALAMAACFLAGRRDQARLAASFDDEPPPRLPPA